MGYRYPILKPASTAVQGNRFLIEGKSFLVEQNGNWFEQNDFLLELFVRTSREMGIPSRETRLFGTAGTNKPNENAKRFEQNANHLEGKPISLEQNSELHHFKPFSWARNRVLLELAVKRLDLAAPLLDIISLFLARMPRGRESGWCVQERGTAGGLKLD